MRWIRGWLYRHGFSPKPGSIFYSPSKYWQVLGAEWAKEFDRSFKEAQDAGTQFPPR